MSRERNRLKGLPEDDELRAEDWAVLATIKDILEPIQRVTNAFEGRSAEFAEIMATTFWLRRKELTLLAGGLRYEYPSVSRRPIQPPNLSLLQHDSTRTLELNHRGALFICQSLHSAIEKLDKYIKMVEETPVEWSAMIVHPGITWYAEYLQ